MEQKLHTKGDTLECGSYHRIELLEHAMKVFERVMEARLRQNMHIDDMQFGFTPGTLLYSAIIHSGALKVDNWIAEALVRREP